MSQRGRQIYLLAIILGLVVAFSSLSRGPERGSPAGVEAKPRHAQRLAAGSWGGPQIQIDVARDSASIEYACANGTIAGPLTLNSKGQFVWRGLHNPERGGPIRLNENPDQHPAVYNGSVKGDTMTLTVKLAGTDETLGTFTLRRGKQARIFKCR